VIIRTLDYTSKFLRRNLRRGGNAVDPITYPINSVRSPFVNSDFLCWYERGKNFANNNAINGMSLSYGASSNGQAPSMAFNNTTLQLNNSTDFSFNQDRGISFWLYNNTTSNNYQAILNKYQSTSSGKEWVIYYINDSGHPAYQKIYLQILNSSASEIFSITGASSILTWEHWTFNYTNSTKTVEMFKNGSFSASGSFVGTPAIHPAALIQFGGIVGTSVNNANCFLSQVILANRTFTSSEVSTLYNSGSGYFTI
jgi:hypothetical protein